VNGDTAWVVDTDAETITTVGGQSRTFSTGAPLLDVAARDDALFVGIGSSAPATQVAGPVVAGVQRVAASTQTVRGTVVLSRNGTVRRPPDQQLAVTPDSVWSIGADGSVERIGDDEVTATVRGLAAVALASGPAGLWAIEENGAIARIDPRSARVTVRTRLPASALGGIAVGRSAVWVSAPDDGVVWRVPSTDVRAARPVRLTRGVRALGVGDGAVWVSNPLAGTLVRLDEGRGTVTRTVATGGHPQDVVVDGANVWVSVAPGAPAAATVPGSIAGVPCERPLGAAGGDPDVLLVSDLPLQGGIRVSTQHMTEAIADVVRARGFHAGRFTVAYLSCDDSIARTGIFDVTRCATNARGYAGEPRVLGVIGALNSPCTRAALAELPGRGPVYVSPLSTDPSLTRPARPRPFTRVIGTDELQAAALALLTRRIGSARVYVIDDGDPMYGAMLADAFGRAAARVGVRVVGAASWDPSRPAESGRVVGLAARNLSADTVVLAGTLDDGGVAVLRAVRRVLGRRIPLLLTDGFTPTPFLSRLAGADAEGAYLAFPGTLLELTPQGRRFQRRLALASPGASIDLGSFYAAEAANVLLDAIARSDGSRASVLREVRRTEVADGLLGPVRFDAAGDLRDAPVTIVRIHRGARSNLDFEDAKLEQVLRPRSALVAP
jgi:branched-chain amino acid transport system substrate-binding protein